LELTKTNVMTSNQPKAKTTTKTKNSQRMIAMATPLTAICQKVVKHTNTTILSLVRKSIGAATPNANVGGATEPSCMPNGLKSSRPNAKREKMAKTTRKQRTNKAHHCSFKFHGQTMPAPLATVSPAFLKAFICNVSPLFIVAYPSGGILDSPSLLLCLGHCLVFYLFLVTISKLLNPLSSLQFQIRSFAMVLTTTNQLIHWNFIPCLPAELIVGLCYLIHASMTILPDKCHHLGLLPLSHHQCRVQAHTTCYASSPPSLLHHLCLFGLLTCHAFATGLTVKWRSPSAHTVLCTPHRHHHPTNYSGRQQFLLHLQMVADTTLRRYESSFSPWSTGWDSTYPCTFPVSQCLQAKAHLLGCAFDQLIAVLPLNCHQQTSTFTFAHMDYNQSHPALLPSGIPDLQQLFGSLAPQHPATYSTTCNIQ